MGRKAEWVPYLELLGGYRPTGNWVCLATGSRSFDRDVFSAWADEASRNGLLEFKGHGEGGELLHDLFDWVIVDQMLKEGEKDDIICTTWHNDESLKDAFWQCFGATCLPATTDYDNLFVVCTDVDGCDRERELTQYILEFLTGDIEDGFHVPTN